MDILGSGDNDWKENGKLIMDFSKIADDSFLSEAGPLADIMAARLTWAWRAYRPATMAPTASSVRRKPPE
jgi:hypothetical protein